MKVEIWSDYVCPFCYIGKRRFEEALEKFPHREHVTIEYKSYELTPKAEINPNLSYYEALACKFGISIEEAIRSSERIKNQGSEAGLTFDFDNMKPTNTFNAHRIAKFATKHGKGKAMEERLFQAYFTDSYHISDHNQLLELALELGLSEAKVIKLLQSEYYTSSVRADEEDAKSIDIKIVPFFVFNEELAVSGLQSIETFTNILEQLWELKCEEQRDQSTEKKVQTTYCTGEGCSIG